MSAGRLGLIAVALLLAACAPARLPLEASPTRISEGRPVMGTVLQIQLEVEDAAAGRILLGQLFDEALRLEGILTTYDPASATERLNRGAEEPIAVPPELHATLSRGILAATETSGAFDITVGPLLALWRRAGERGSFPTAEELEASRALVGAGRIRLTPGHAQLSPGMRVDFGGLGKGWALDQMGAALTENVSAALFDFGGSSWLAQGAPHGEPGWRVLVAHQAGQNRVVTLRDESLSVSESLGQWTEIDGKRVSHIIDPRSGAPVPQAGLAAVRAARGADAEVWSTALLVLGSDGLAAAAAQGHEALLLDEAGGRHATENFGEQVLLAPPRSEGSAP